MSNEWMAFWFGGIMGFMIGMCTIIPIAVIKETNSVESIRSEATRAGVAERTIDQETGKTGFRFIPDKTKENSP